MNTQFVPRAAVLALVASLVVPLAGQQAPPAPNDEDLSIQALVESIELAFSTMETTRWTELLSPNADREMSIEFFESIIPDGVTRAVVRERDRVPLSGALPGEGFQLLVDTFIETDARGRIYTWSVDIRKPRDSQERQPWRIAGQERLSSVEGLHRLALNADKQFTVKDLVLRSIDLELRLTGDMFVAETSDGVTGVVLLGDGFMAFTPAPAEERGQVRIFAGTETIETPFTAAFIRLNPLEFELQVREQLPPPTRVDRRALRRAQEVFDDEVAKSFSLDLRDLSRDSWSLLPQAGDFLAEVRTRRFNTLTFARAFSEAEDVTLFHRGRQRNIASYASEMKLSSRGRFFNEDDLVEYDVLNYDIDAHFQPDRQWLDGRTSLRLRVKAFALAALTIRLADDFNVSSVTSDKLGRLMYLRVRNQNNIVINLPTPVAKDMEMTLTVTYSGPIRTQPLDQESIASGDQAGRPVPRSDDLPYIPPEPSWLFSNRSHWYPQNQVTDYATANVRFNVPGDYKVVVSGIESLDSPVVTVRGTAGAPDRVTYIFDAPRPLRYIGAVVSRFSRVDRTAVAVDVDGERNTVLLAVDANRRQQDRSRDIVPIAADVIRMYASIIGEIPYDSFTLAMVEHDRPGGHSPAYFAMLNNPLPLTPWQARQDPAAFNNFPEFYLAHEIAHQWWGQAIGWKNYHEQWLSEGLAQYFAAMYSKERRGEQAFREVLRHLRRWAMDQSDQGAIYLGYRLGHIKGDSRVFRAIVYNKGASVLHMLRRLLGDEAFFAGLRHYYRENKFQKAGTEDLQRAMEAEAGESLERYFEKWVYGSALPRVRYSTAVEGQDLVVRFEQSADVFDIPVTVTINYGDRTVEEVVALRDAVVERRVPLSGTLRSVEVNGDNGALGHFDRVGGR